MPKYKIDYQNLATDYSETTPLINPYNFTGKLDVNSNYLDVSELSPSLITDVNAEARLNEIKAQNQNSLDTSANNIGAGIIKTGSTLIGSVGYMAGIVNGLSKAIGRGIDENDTFRFDRRDFIDNPLIYVSEIINKTVEEYLPDYKTRDEQDNPLALRNFLGSVATTTVRDALPFFAAFILQGMVLGKIMGSFDKVNKLKKLAEQAVKTGGKGVEEMSKFKGAMQKFWQTADQKAIRELMIAQEAIIEGHHVSDKVKEENYTRFYDKLIKNGLSEIDAQQMAEKKSEELANSAFGTTFMMNQGILRLGNIEMKSLFSPAMGSRRPYEALKKSWSELKGVKEYATKAGKTVFNSEVAKESLEEVAQGATGVATEEQMKEIGFNDRFTAFDFLETGVNTLTGTVKRLGTSEGQLEALSSIVLTGGASILNKKRNNQQDRLKDELRKSVLNSNVSEEYKSMIQGLTVPQEDGTTMLSDLGKDLINKARTGLELNMLADASEATGNDSLYGVVRNQQLANIAFNHFEFGLGEELEKKIDEVAKEELKRLQAEGKAEIYDYEQGKKISIDEHVINLKNKIRSFESIYNSIETNYGITDNNLRAVIFNNSIQQNELNKKIKNYKPIIGESWFNQLKASGKEESVYLQELEKRKEELDVIKKDRILTKEELEESIKIDTTLNLYDNYQLQELQLTNVEQQNNLKAYKNKSTDIAFLNKLKEDFIKHTNPETQQESINAKVQADEQRSDVSTIPGNPVGVQQEPVDLKAGDIRELNGEKVTVKEVINNIDTNNGKQISPTVIVTNEKGEELQVSINDLKEIQKTNKEKIIELTEKVKNQLNNLSDKILGKKKTLNSLKREIGNTLEKIKNSKKESNDFTESFIKNIEERQDEDSIKTYNEKLEDFKKEQADLINLAKNLENQIKQIKQEIKELIEEKEDIELRIQYYNTIINSKEFETIDKKVLIDKKNDVQSVLNTVNKLIDKLRKLLDDSFILLKDITDVITNRFKNLEKFKSKGFNKYFLKFKNNNSEYNKLLEQREKGTIRSIDNELLINYQKLSDEYFSLEKDLENALEHGEITEEVLNKDKEKLNQLIKTSLKYQRQIRFLEDLIDITHEEIKQEPVVEKKEEQPSDEFTSQSTETTETETKPAVINDITIGGKYKIGKNNKEVTVIKVENGRVYYNEGKSVVSKGIEDFKKEVGIETKVDTSTTKDDVETKKETKDKEEVVNGLTVEIPSSEHLPIFSFEDLRSSVVNGNVETSTTEDTNKKEKKKFSLVTTDYFNQVRTSAKKDKEGNFILDEVSRTDLLMSKDSKNKIRIRIHRGFNKSTKPDAEPINAKENTEDVVVYNNKGLNAVDMTVEYLDENGKWQDYGSLNTVNRLRTPEGKVIRLGDLTFEQFSDVFNLLHADNKQEIQFTEEGFKKLIEEEEKFIMFEKYLLDKYKEEGKEFLVDKNIFDTRVTYFIDNTPSDLSTIIEDIESKGGKVNIVFDGKDNNGKSRTKDIPKELVKSNKILNKTYAEIVYPNGQTIWKIVYPKKQDSKLEKEISEKLKALAEDIKSKKINLEDSKKRIAEINNEVFILNPEEKYIDLKVFENSGIISIKARIKDGKSVTLWEDNKKYTKVDLDNHFSFSNIANTLNASGLVNITKDSFISNISNKNISPENLMINFSKLTNVNLKIEVLPSNIPIEEKPVVEQEPVITEETKEESKEGLSLEDELDKERKRLSEQDEAPFSKFINSFEVLSTQEQELLKSKGITSTIYNNSPNEIKKQLLFQSLNC